MIIDEVERDFHRPVEGLQHPRKVSMNAQFDHWDACDDLLENEVDLPVQDYFRNILFLGVCAICGNVNRILDMDL